MELDITDFVKGYLLTGNAIDFSCSQAERGSYAGQGSYSHAVETSLTICYVVDDNREAFTNYFKGFGAWDVEEMNEWTHGEMNGVFLQLIASEYREFGGTSDENVESPIYHDDDDDTYIYYVGF